MTNKYLNNEHGLPVPRIQARILKNGQNVDVVYSLITKNIEGLFEYIHHESNFSSPSIAKEELHQLRPHNTMAIMFADMWNFKLPAFIVSNENFAEITFDNSITKIPRGVLYMMKENKERKEEFDKIVNKLIQISN